MQNNTNTPSNNNINDFGQKIGGARKDLYAEAREWAATVAAIDADKLAAAGPTPTNEKTAPTDAEILETAARIRANYEAIKAEAEQPAANLPEWAKEFAPVTYTHHGRTLTGYIMNIHKAFRGNRYICTFNEEGTLFTTFVDVSDCTPLLEAA